MNYVFNLSCSRARKSIQQTKKESVSVSYIFKLPGCKRMTLLSIELKQLYRSYIAKSNSLLVICGSSFLKESYFLFRASRFLSFSQVEPQTILKLF